MLRTCLALALLTCIAPSVAAQTTTTYTYDTFGRLRTVEQSGSTAVHNRYDRSDNRVAVTNSTNGWNTPPVANPSEAAYNGDTSFPFSTMDVCLTVSAYDTDDQTVTLTSATLNSGATSSAGTASITLISSPYLCIVFSQPGYFWNEAHGTYTVSDGITTSVGDWTLILFDYAYY